MKVTHSDRPGPRPYRAAPGATAKSSQGVEFGPPERRQKSKPLEPVKIDEPRYTIAEAAEKLGTSERHVRGLVEKKRIRHVHIGKFVRIPESGLTQLLAEGTVEPT